MCEEVGCLQYDDDAPDDADALKDVSGEYRTTEVEVESRQSVPLSIAHSIPSTWNITFCSNEHVSNASESTILGLYLNSSLGPFYSYILNDLYCSR